MKSRKAIITVVGKDAVGILAKTCSYLSEENVNILDISQTVVQNYFSMMMIVDYAQSKIPFVELAANLNALGAKLGMEIHCQKSEIFEKMHRV